MLNIFSLHKCWLSWLPNTLLLHTNINFSAFLNYNLPRARGYKDIKQKFKMIEFTTPDLKTQYSANIKIFIFRLLKSKQNKKHSGTMWMIGHRTNKRRKRKVLFYLARTGGNWQRNLLFFKIWLSLCFSLLYISARASNPNAFLKNMTFPNCPSFPKIVLLWPIFQPESFLSKLMKILYGFLSL